MVLTMIGFRVDANEKIATGHLVRCISIATELQKRNISCIFFLAEHKETARLDAAGLPYEILHTDWQDMESEYPVLLPLLEQYPLQWLVVDSYQATGSYLETLDKKIPVLYIDDMEQEPYDITALLHYGLHPDYEAYLQHYENTAVKILEGTDYIPLREEFQQLSDTTHREKSIMITTGGTDPYHICLQFLTACLELAPQTSSTRASLKDFSFDVIVGSMNQDEPQLQALAARHPGQVHLHKNVTNMSYYMCRNMLAVSAGGTTLWELCACSTPTICFSFADNQMEGVREMGWQNIMICAGDARREPVIDNILHGLNTLIENETLRREYAGHMHAFVDGQGVKRIVDFLTL